MVNIKEILENRIFELNELIKIEDPTSEHYYTLIGELLDVTKEYNSTIGVLNSTYDTVKKNELAEKDSKRKIKNTLITGGIIIGSTVIGVILDSITGRIETRKESKMKDTLTSLLKK